MSGKKKNIMMIGLLFVLLLGLIVPAWAQSETGTKTIRVAYREDADFINKSSSGVYKGYGVEYLNKISQYTGWKYEYINESWEDQLEDLKCGKVDLICNAQKTEDREKDYDFSCIPIGTEQAVLYTSEDNEDIYFQDYEHMNGKKVGLLRDSYQNEEFEQRQSEKNFRCLEKYYESEQEQIEALEQKKVDMILMGSISKHDSLKIVDKFGAAPMYIIATKGNTEVMNGVNNALEQLESEVPDLREQLTEQYFMDRNRNSKPLFTREETEYIKNVRAPIKIGCIGDQPPLVYTDKETGKLDGIYIALLEKFSEISGISFELKSLSSDTDPIEAAQSGNYDFIAGITGCQEMIDDPEVHLTGSFFTREFQIVAERGADINTLEMPIVSINSIFKKYKSLRPEGGFSHKAIYCDSPQAILDAVVNKKADMAVVDSYAASYYLQDEKYHNLALSGIVYTKAETCMIYADNVDPNLVSVINKSIGSLSSQDEENIIRQYSINLMKTFSIWELLWKYKYQMICILIFLVALTVIVIANNRHRTQMQVEAAAQEAYRSRMETDELTGLLNKEGFYRRGSEFLEEHSEADARILYINIENFKLVNDLFGEDAGDEFLKFIGRELEKNFGRIDIISCRYEADHFVILTLESEGRIQAQMNRLCDRIRDYYLKTTVEISAGIYEIRDRSKSLRIMCDRAHLAAESIKKNHMAQIAVYDDTHRKKLIQEQMIINELGDALKEKQFKAFFQPKYDMRTDRIIGAEALVRWEHPEKGLLSPGIFIPVLEKNGYIAKVDLYIYEETCIFLKKCMDEGIPLYPVSVNLSRVGFYNPKLFQTLCEIAERYHIPKKYLELEITETAYATDSEMIFSVVEKLRQGGFRVLMDDFGSGYSSLNMLKEAPIDEIKLDMRFLSAADPYERAEEILHMIITMGNHMKLSIIAEGVETEQQKAMLQGYGCNKAQGYFYARPMREEEYTELLRKETKENL